jgi:biotin carboxyl carrier protein
MQFYQKMKRELAASGWKNEVHHRADLTPDDFREGRLVPTERLVARLGVGTYHAWPVAWDESEVRADRVAISLKQHIGMPAQPIVAEGDTVSIGQLIATPPEGKLGASIHASIAGRVSSVGDKTVVIEA